MRWLSIFGSTLHGEARPDSDLDVLVEFMPGHVPGFFTFVGLQFELSAAFGRQVDLRTPEDLSKYFRKEVGSATDLCKPLGTETIEREKSLYYYNYQ